MNTQVRCNLCEELVTRTSSFCSNCGSDLSTGISTEFSFQDTGFETSRTGIPSASLDDPKVVLGNPNFFLDFVLNVFYFVLSYGIIQTTLNLNPSLDLLGNRLSQNDINVLVGLWGLMAVSMIKGYLVIKSAPPEPYPEGWQLPNTIVGIIFFPIFFIGIPYFVLGLPLAILVTFIVLIWFFFAPYKQRKNPTTRMSRTRRIAASTGYKLDPSSESFVAKDVSDDELPAPTDETLKGFIVKKSGNFEVTYQINYSDNREYIVAFRTAKNRLAIYAMILIAFFGFPMLFSFSDLFFLPFELDLGVFLLQATIFPFIFLMLLLLIFVPNKWILVRRMTIRDAHDGTPIGSIKGNLYFTHWKVSDLKGEYNASLQFPLVGHKGEINTHSASLSISGDRRRTKVFDSQNNTVFSVISPESIYVRKQFSIESNDQLTPFLVATLSVCIIERFYKPQSRNN